ncbi:germ cell-less protein-like 1 [Octopus bimaculoides]|nr:germ cell-less protein-like 1 [Octopus bimaculoides]
MGNVSSYLGHRLFESGVKRKREFILEDNETDLDIPKRRRLKSTTKHIYDTLFVNGQGSDITIKALGQEWRLHKMYISQSAYFACMFNGSWKESDESVINIDIVDPNIDVDALNITLGSFYNDNVLIRPTQVVSILAAARLLQLEDLIQQCESIMKDSISATTVCKYYMGATMYGALDVESQCLQWLQRNLLSLREIDLLKDISCELMEKIVGSPNLCVLQVELDVYTLVKKWLYLQLFPDFEGDMTSLSEQMGYFKGLAEGKENHYFLMTKEGRKYISVFRQVRFHHIINDMQSVKTLYADHIVSPEWLQPYFTYQWNKMLAVDQGLDKGPQQLSEEEFNKTAMRCGRILQKNGKYCWRWTGYSYGFDLLIILTKRGFVFKRNTQSQPYNGSVSLQPTRRIFYKFSVMSLDKSGMVTYSKSTPIHRLRFVPDEDIPILTLEEAATFPLHICFNVVYVTPCETVPLPTLPTLTNEDWDKIDDIQGMPSSSVHLDSTLNPESLLSNSSAE